MPETSEVLTYYEDSEISNILSPVGLARNILFIGEQIYKEACHLEGKKKNCFEPQSKGFFTGEATLWQPIEEMAKDYLNFAEKQGDS